MATNQGRYAGLGHLTAVSEDGTKIVYLERRFLPQARRQRQGGKVVVRQGDRMDLIAARTLGQALAWWRIADSNDAMNPWLLAATPGRTLRLPSSKSQIEDDS